MPAITWRNINSQESAAGVRLLDSAQENLNAGVAGFQNIIKQRQDMAARNQQTLRENNTQSFLDTLAKYRTPEELQAAQARGEIENLRAGFGRNIDASQVRDADESRLATLRRNANEAQAFEQGQLTQRAAPIAEQIKGLMYENKDDEAQALIAEHRDLLGQANLLSGLQGDILRQNRIELMQGREDHAYDRQIKQEQAGDLLAQETNAAVNDYFAERQARDNMFISLATELGVPLVNGDIDYERASPEAIRQLQERVALAGLDQLPSQTQALRGLEGRLRSQAGNAQLAPGAIDQAVSGAEASLARANSLASGDAAELSGQLAAARSAYGMERNPYYLEQNFNPPQAAAEAIRQVANTEDFQNILENNAVRRSLVQQATDALQNGVEIRTEDGRQVRIPFTPSDVQNAILRVGKNFFFDDEAKDFKKILRDYAQDEGMLSRLEDFTKYRELENNLREVGRAKYDNGNNFESRMNRLRQAAAAAQGK